MEQLSPTFFIVFLILILAGITLIIFNNIAVRRKSFIKDDVVEPIMQEIQNLNIEGAKALCDQYKLPVCSILKGGLERIQDDELDIESNEKGLDENSGLELAKPLLGSTCSTQLIHCSNDWSAWYGCWYDWSICRFDISGNGWRGKQANGH